MDELEKLLSEDPEKETQKSSSDDTERDSSKEEKPDPEVLKKEEIKANLDAAIREAQDELKRIRKEKQKVRTGEEEDLLRIDMDDPSAKAWDKHIREQVNPVRHEIEQDKAEILKFTLRDFLSDRPALSSKPEKVKELIAKYEKIKESSGRTKEGVMADLESAYAALFHRELLDMARGQRVDQAKADSAFSDIAVSKGATAYSSNASGLPKETLTTDERDIAIRWYGSVENYLKAKKGSK